MTPENLIYFAMAIAAAVGGVYWRFSMVINDKGNEINGVRNELAEHKVEVAKTYVTRAGLQEQTGQIMRAIEGVANRIDGLNDRLDRLYEAKPPRRQ